jgi:hypothetical protein
MHLLGGVLASAEERYGIHQGLAGADASRQKRRARTEGLAKPGTSCSGVFVREPWPDEQIGMVRAVPAVYKKNPEELSRSVWVT